MKKLLIRLSILPLIPVLGIGLAINGIYWIISGKTIDAQWLEKWLDAIEDEII